MEPIWGFDLGGTKIEGVILKSKDEPNNIIARMRVPTEKTKGYDHIIGQIGLLVNNLKEATGLIPTRIGLGTPGALDPITQTHKNSNTTAINGMPFKRDLEKALGISFEMANDA
ncbi:MAG: ROK family protein, partial [Bacteroidota bacterium]